MEVNSYTLEDALQEIWDRALDQGVNTREAWNDMVDEVIEDHVDLGQMDSDQDTENWKEVLKHRWQEYRVENANQLEETQV